MKKNRFALKIVLGLLAVFAVWNVVWLVYTQIKYSSYKDAVGYDDQRERWYYCDDDNYVFGVYLPTYLSFTGNLYITQVLSVENDGTLKNKNTYDMIIWPKMNGEYEYGISIGENSESSQSVVSNEFMLDEKMQSTENLTDEEKKMLEENADEIAILYCKAKEMWSELTIEVG